MPTVRDLEKRVKKLEKQVDKLEKHLGKGNQGPQGSLFEWLGTEQSPDAQAGRTLMEWVNTMAAIVQTKPGDPPKDPPDPPPPWGET